MTAPSTAEHAGLDFLALLKAELIEHVRRARGGLDLAAAGAVDGGGPAVCRDAMQQVEGVLHTLGLERLALLAEELAKVARCLPALPAERQQDVVGILRDGLDQLRDGIEHRAAGRPEPVWGLVAALNELRASLGLPLVSEVCLFAPDLEQTFASLPVAPSSAGHELEEAARRERAVLHRGLYLWYSGREPERGLRKLRRVAQVLREAAATEPMQHLFLILEAVVVAVADGSFVAGGAIRRVLAGVDQLLKQIGEAREDAVAASLPMDLVRDLLFYVAASGSAHRIVRAVRGSVDLRLVVATGSDGRDRVVSLLGAEVRRVREWLARTDQDVATGLAVASLAAKVQRLADGLALAELGDQRRELGASLEALRRPAGGGGAVSDRLAQLDEALGRVAGALHAQALGGEAAEPQTAVPASPAAVVSSDASIVEQEVVAVDQELERLAAAAPGACSAARLAPLDDEIREVFLDEAAEKVEAMRRDYVAWSARRDDGPALDAVLESLDSLKSTGRLVGADTLSEVCWVLEAALRGCRDGALVAIDETLAVLDDGIEMVDALVSAHLSGTPVESEPRLVEQRLYALLTPVATSPSAGGARATVVSRVAPPQESSSESPRDPARGAALDADTFEGDLDLVELFAEEAGDLADALEEGLRGLEQDPARSAWLMEMRRALRALAAAARHAELPQLRGLCEAFDAFLARTAAAGAGVGPDALALTREATGAAASVVEALRGKRLPHVPADLIERLREAGARSAAAAPPAMGGTGGTSTPLRESSGGCEVGAPPLPDPELAQRVIERASGAGVCHLRLEEQVAVLREQVGRLEGVLALLRRRPVGDATALASPRLGTALADLGSCADRLHETSLTISAQLRAQGHHLTGLQQGLAVIFAGLSGPTFADLLVVGIGAAAYALPAPAVESVRRLAPDLIPPDGELLEMRGRAFVYRHLAGLLGMRRDESASAAKPRSVVLVRVGDQACALGVDSVIGHRTLLVAAPPAAAQHPQWLVGLAPLGGERDAPVVDLDCLLARV